MEEKHHNIIVVGRHGMDTSCDILCRVVEHDTDENEMETNAKGNGLETRGGTMISHCNAI